MKGFAAAHRQLVWTLSSLCALCSCAEGTNSIRQFVTQNKSLSVWSFADLPTPIDSEPARVEFGFEEVGRFGTPDGPGWLSEASTVVANDSVLIVGEARACEFVVFSRKERREKHRFGQCGDGPGDFRYTGAIAMLGDRMLITDHRSRRGQFVNQSGMSEKAWSFDSSAIPVGNDMRNIFLWRDSLFIVNVWQHGHAFKNGVVLPNAPDAPFVRAATLNGAATGIRAIVEGSGVSSSNYGEIREETACVVAGNTVRSPRLVTLNRWSAQLVVLNIDSLVKGSPALELNRIVTTVPLAASQSVLRPNSLVAKHLEIACGDELALISIRAYDDSASRLATGAHMVVVVPGMREHGVRFIDSSFVPALGSLKAAHGQSFFFGHDSRFGYPQVVEVRLQLKTIHWLVSQSLRLPRRL